MPAKTSASASPASRAASKAASASAGQTDLLVQRADRAQGRLLGVGIELDRALEVALGALGVEPRGLAPAGGEQVLRLARRIVGVDLGEQRERQRRRRVELGAARERGAGAVAVVLEHQQTAELELQLGVVGLAREQRVEVGPGGARVAPRELGLRRGEQQARIGSRRREPARELGREQRPGAGPVAGDREHARAFDAAGSRGVRPAP